MFPRALLPNICFYGGYRFFFKEGVSENTSASVFQFPMRHGCITRGKIKRPDACYMVES